MRDRVPDDRRPLSILSSCGPDGVFEVAFHVHLHLRAERLACSRIEVVARRHAHLRPHREEHAGRVWPGTLDDERRAALRSGDERAVSALERTPALQRALALAAAVI